MQQITGTFYFLLLLVAARIQARSKHGHRDACVLYVALFFPPARDSLLDAAAFPTGNLANTIIIHHQFVRDKRYVGNREWKEGRKFFAAEDTGVNDYGASAYNRQQTYSRSVSHDMHVSQPPLVAAELQQPKQGT